LPTSPEPLATTEVTMLFASCGCAAIFISAFIAFNFRRRRSQVGLLQPSGYRSARLPSSNADLFFDRAVRQSLLRHQFEAFIRVPVLMD
jgi:hypothetical protein